MRQNVGPIQLILAALMGLSRIPVKAQVPSPVFRGLVVRGEVTLVGTGFSYRYAIRNVSTNTLPIKVVKLDLKTGGGDSTAVPVGVTGGFAIIGARTGMVAWGPGDANRTPPGLTFEGFGLESSAVPMMRRVIVEPYLLDYMRAVREDREARGQDLLPGEYRQIEASFLFEARTIGPLGVAPGSFEHWDTLLADVAQAKQLGWLADPALAATVGTNLAAARQAVVAGDPSAAKANLQTVIDAMQQSTPAQRTSEGYGLVSLNAKFLYDYLVATAPWPWEPKLTLAPERASHSLGETHTATAALFNVATKAPIGGWIDISIASGPHQGLETSWYSDAQGQLSLAYRGLRLGEDDIVACTRIESGPPCVHASVKWEGGPDLVVTLWVPPLLISAPGQEFVVSEETRNLGTLPAPASVTRYYISTSAQIDPATAITFGERNVPPLAVSERSRVDRQPFTIPASLPPGTYSLAACADADNLIAELDEDNNCSYSTVFSKFIVPVEKHNSPPNCSKAMANPNLLWPPNHTLVPIAIAGITDPDGDLVTITITGITQDEPTNGLGDGDTAPDGFGVGTTQAQVRAERSGTANGRVYAISFRAEDGKDGACTGVVAVGVPHDQGKGSTPIDDGQKYDSTK
jgi:CARDB